MTCGASKRPSRRFVEGSLLALAVSPDGSGPAQARRLNCAFVEALERSRAFDGGYPPKLSALPFVLTVVGSQ